MKEVHFGKGTGDVKLMAIFLMELVAAGAAYKITNCLDGWLIQILGV